MNHIWYFQLLAMGGFDVNARGTVNERPKPHLKTRTIYKECIIWLLED